MKPNLKPKLPKTWGEIKPYFVGDALCFKNTVKTEPSIPVAEVSRIIVNYKKWVQRELNKDPNSLYLMTRLWAIPEILKRLNLRGRARR